MEYVVDEHKNLMPLMMPDIKQFDINWTDETPLYDSSSNATANPISLEVNQGVITPTILDGGYKWVGVPKGSFLILAFSGTFISLVTEVSVNGDFGYYPYFELNSNSNPMAVKLAPQLVDVGYRSTAIVYYVLSETRCLILRMA